MMMTKPTLAEAPEGSVVTTAELKEHLRVDFSDDDDQIEGFIEAATAHLDGYAGILGRCLLSQEWEFQMSEWPWDCLLLPFPDVSAVTISYKDAAGADQAVDAGMIELIEAARGTTMYLQDGFSKPALFQDIETPITVTMTVGFGDIEGVPRSIKIAIMMLAAHFYEHRGAAEKAELLPMGVNALVAPYRRAFL